MDKLNWIKDLIRAEQKMEESGVVDFTAGFDAGQMLITESIQFLHELKAAFVDAASNFNQLKGTAVGRVKIYGISNTHADFMLFRNGFKLIFSLKEPGLVAIRFHYIGSNFALPSATSAAYHDASSAASTHATNTTASANYAAGASISPMASGLSTSGMMMAQQNKDDLLQARWGAFGDLIWTFLEQPIKIDYLVRYYLTRFVRESAK